VIQVKTGNVNQVSARKEFVLGDKKMIAVTYMKIVMLAIIVDKLKIGLIKMYAQV
jgi:hypothetical protein